MQCRPCYAAGKRHCAKCQREVLEVPAKLAEAIAEQFRVRCSYAEKGCQETVQFKVGPVSRGRGWKAAFPTGQVVILFTTYYILVVRITSPTVCTYISTVVILKHFFNS